MASILVEDWGLIPYNFALQKQFELVSQIADGDRSRFVFCSHPSVVTLGRASKPQDIMGWTGEICETNRGGRATYHGPNQLVLYPLVNISRTRDIAKFLRELEALVIKGLAEFGLECHSKSKDNLDERSFTGVWVKERKIASIGIAVKKWVTHHGVAINLYPDSKAFQGIQPCGFNTSIMTDVQSELGVMIDRDKLKEALVGHSGMISN